MICIIDCYTDEPSGLGVPPYLGTYPRYIVGAIEKLKEEYKYLRIDDLRFTYKNNKEEINRKTNISINNLSQNFKETEEILSNADFIIVIAGMHTPGKYLTANPGSIKEVSLLIEKFNGTKIITGPAAFASLFSGGQKLSDNYKNFLEENFDYVVSGDLWGLLNKIIKGEDFNPNLKFSYNELKEIAPLGAGILKQINQPYMLEIETAKGCPRKNHCSFCLEPLKNQVAFRDYKDILDEVKELNKNGGEHFRLGKQADFYSYPQIKELLTELDKLKLKTLHIDNVDPASVVSKKGEEITKLICKYCSEGNVAAFGVESFDPKVIKANNLHSHPQTIIKAIEIINKYGQKRGKKGLPLFLPGINLLLGLINENKETLNINLESLKEIFDKGLLLRRINIRQVDIFPNTQMSEIGSKFIRKNKKHYFSFKRKVREEIDFKMLEKVFPKGIILKDVYMEVFDGNHTFGKQLGTYPIVVGINKRVKLKEFYEVKIIKHQLRSLTGEVLIK
jgi:radical SAM superfamily enzyme with C-terminal helix-hairpin-helix motif